MTLSTTQIENQAEAHRAHVSELIDELRARVTPGEVLDQLLGWEDGHEIARTFGRQVKNNPLPLALIGTGVAWLMFSDSTQSRNGGHDYVSRGGVSGTAGKLSDRVGEGIAHASDSVADAADYVKSTTANAQDRIKDTATQFSDSASSALEYGRQTAQSLTDTAQSAYAKTKDTVSAASDTITTTATSAWQKTTEVTQSATDSIKQTGTSVGRLAQEQPLLVAGLGFALGMALGSILPATETENSLVGEQSDAVKQKAGDLAGEGYEKAKAVAQRGYEAATEAVKEEAHNQGLPDTDAQSTEQGGGTEMTSSQDTGGRSYGGNDGGDHSSGRYPQH